MKALLSWLKEHIHIKDNKGNLSDQAHNIANILTRGGFETTWTPAFEWAQPFQVAMITRVDSHPNADTLHVCTVQTEKDGNLTVVCGCPNVRRGIKVILARPGCLLPGQKTPLKVSNLRGIESQGMLCSATELWVEDLFPDDVAVNRIIHVPDHVSVGTSLRDLIPEDLLFHVEVTANRGDVGHHYGLAREMAALGLGSLIQPCLQNLPHACQSVDVKTPSCSQVQLCTLFHVRQGVTPSFMRRRLLDMGVTCHFPCVDITNYMAEDCGQPLHAFDADALQGPVRVRSSIKGESFHALDDQTYTLPEGAIVIEDDLGLLSLAGIMGGKRGSCRPDTKNIVLEAATFDPKAIARTARSVKMISQARHRFERGVDPYALVRGLSITAHWIKDHCGGSLGVRSSYGTPEKDNQPIVFHPTSVLTLGGARIPENTIIDRLQNMGAKVDTRTKPWSITPPSWRYDWHGQADCVEETLRINGYEDVQSQPLPGAGLSPYRQVNVGQSLSHCPYYVNGQARRFLIDQGIYETVNWSFINKKMATTFSPSLQKETNVADMTVANPLSSDLSVMRPSIIPSLIQVYHHHKRFSLPFAPIFEMAPVFWGLEPAQQHQGLGMLFPTQNPKDWIGQKERSFYDIKGIVEHLLKTISVTKGTWKPQGPDWMHPYQCASYFLPHMDNTVAWIGKVHPDLSCQAWAVEIMMDMLHFDTHRSNYVLPPLQPVFKDLSFFVPEKKAIGPVLTAMHNAGQPTLTQMRLIDRFYDTEQKSVSVAIQATFQATDHQAFTATVLHQHMNTLVKCAEQSGWILRGSLPIDEE